MWHIKWNARKQDTNLYFELETKWVSFHMLWLLRNEPNEIEAREGWSPRRLKHLGIYLFLRPTICQNRSPVCRTANEVPEPKAASFTARLVATGGALMRNVGRSIIAHVFKTTRRNINALYSWGLRVTAEDSEKGVTAEDSEKNEKRNPNILKKTSTLAVCGLLRSGQFLLCAAMLQRYRKTGKYFLTNTTCLTFWFWASPVKISEVDSKVCPPYGFLSRFMNFIHCYRLDQFRKLHGY